MPESRLTIAPRDLRVLTKSVPEDASGAPPPSNSEIRKIAEDVAGALKYSFAAVAASPEAAVRPDSVEAAFKEAIQSLPQKKRDEYQKTASDLVKASAGVRRATFGRAGERTAEEHIGAAGGFARYHEGLAPLQIDRKLLGVRTPRITIPRGALRATSDGLLIPGSALPANFDDFESDFESSAALAEKSNVVDETTLEDIYGPVYRNEDIGDSAAPDDFEEMAVTDKMGFWISRVKCVDETNPEWWGSDEIALAGISVDEDGDTKKISEKYIGGGFDDGDTKNYSNWRYHWFSLREGTQWPKTYSVTLLLAEKDHGGLSSALNKIWEKVKDEVKKAIAKAISEALTAYLGPVIAKAIGEAVAWVVGLLVGWIISAFKDDIFPPFTARVTTPSMSARWYYPNGTWGNPSSGSRYAHFYGHGGHYYVRYHWKFFA